ncbi:ESPR-type extended signal peptide-containing protein, partial [Moraxella catarrhalis]|uniref:ESPR-type extended signal peptide-containing protein n=1 Tax=Moraxella catarrhalis TaxID=480 RepID=UPI0012CC80EE
MNHIYKVIFNKATGTFMAVAEYAKSHSTGGSCATGQVGSVCTLSFARIAALAVLVIGATLSGSAYAAGDSAIEIDQKIQGANKSARATGEASIAVGSLAKANGNQAIAIGSVKPDPNNNGNGNVGSRAQGHESIAIGGDVLAQGHASIAIGSDDLYLPKKLDLSNALHKLIDGHAILKKIQIAPNGKDKYRRTTARGHASTAVGAMSYAQGDFSNAFGTYATAKAAYSLAVGLAATAEQQSAIAIGSNAQAKNFRTVALGADAIVDLPQGIALGYGSKVLATDNNAKTPYILTGESARQHAATWSPLSIGTLTQRRRIINVGAGSDDTDAVNVAQLKAAVGLANRKITFKGDGNDNSVQKGLGQTLNITGGQVDTSQLTDSNIGVVKDNGNDGGLKVKLAK